MAEAELGGGVGDMLGLERIDRARHAGLDVAEGAGAGAGVAQDHHRRVLLGPAFADIRAGRFLAHGGEVEPAHQRLARFGEAGAGRRLDANPVGLALTRGAVMGARASVMSAQIAMSGATCHPCPSLANGRDHKEQTACRTSTRSSQAIAASAKAAGSSERERWAELAEGQSPKVMVIACSDSRVDPAQIFDASPGEMFVVRNVANLVPPFELGGGRHGVSAALEFAVTQLEVEESW